MLGSLIGTKEQGLPCGSLPSTCGSEENQQVESVKGKTCKSHVGVSPGAISHSRAT